MTKAPPEASAILVVRYRFIGDTILTVPFLRNLRQAYPKARIDVLVGPQSGEVLEGCPYVDELITFDTTRFHKYDRGKGAARSFWSYVKELKRRKYDTAFVLKRSFSSALLCLLIGCRNRTGYGNWMRSFLLTCSVDWDRNIHEVESTLELLAAAGIPVGDTSLEAWISESERQELAGMLPELAGRRTKVLFHAAAAHPDKTYPLSNWSELIKVIGSKTDIMPVFAGSAQDFQTYETLKEDCPFECLNTAGKLSLRQSIVLMSFMNLSICTDSGPAHLSAAAGTPTIALFGPTDPVRWRPWGENHLALFDAGLPCRPCNYKKSCDNRRQCLTELSPELIGRHAMQMLSSESAAVHGSCLSRI